MAAEFSSAVHNMKPLVRRALMDGDTSVDPEAMMHELQLSEHAVKVGLRSLQTGVVSSVKAVLTPAQCTALQFLAPNESSSHPDNVDGATSYQRNFTKAELQAVLGDEVVNELWSLPLRYAGGQQAPLGNVRAIVRSYSKRGRPFIPFHVDRSRFTVNVALEDSSLTRSSGGQLMAMYQGRLRAIARAQGEATIHGPDVLHAVAFAPGGTRSALVLFFE